jgi:PEP-CTERM putative exosortase interaction domain
MRLVSFLLPSLIALPALADFALPAIPAVPALPATPALPDLGMLVIVPEPNTGLLLVAGLVGLAAWRRRRT